MHSRVYAERTDKAQKRMLAAVAKLRESGLVDAPETLPVDRDPRITELLRMEYVAEVLFQMAERPSVPPANAGIEGAEPESKQPPKGKK